MARAELFTKFVTGVTSLINSTDKLLNGDIGGSVKAGEYNLGDNYILSKMSPIMDLGAAIASQIMKYTNSPADNKQANYDSHSMPKSNSPKQNTIIVNQHKYMETRNMNVTNLGGI